MTADERRLLCPTCGMMIPIPDGTRPGDMFECPNCAGIMLRLGEKNGEEVLLPVQMISCPSCGERIPIDEETPVGTAVRHDGVDYVLTKEFGAFALEAV
ncbi:MAG TPA: hypothetical protein DDZ83_10110 [Nitrospinae bacterium]|nr:hypothetical protein [Nitrospinota bacterium]